MNTFDQHYPQSTRLRQVNWNTEQDDQCDEDILYTAPSSTKGNKDITREFQKLHQKILDKQKKKAYNNNQIVIPSNRDALLLKYGPPAPQGTQKVSGPRPYRLQQEKNQLNSNEIPSYKKDAMRLIINRIYRQIGNVFNELQRKVMRDDIMRQRKELYELMNQQQKQNFMQRTQRIAKMNKGGNENDQQAINREYPVMGKERIESKKRLLCDNYDQIFMKQQHLQQEEEDSQSQRELNSLYETPGKDEILQIENYTQQDYGENSNLDQYQLTSLDLRQVTDFNGSILSAPTEGRDELKLLSQFKENSYESVRKPLRTSAINNRYNDEQEEEEKLNQYGGSMVHSEKLQSSPIIQAETSHEYSKNLSEYKDQVLEQESLMVIQPAIKKQVASYLIKEYAGITPKAKGIPNKPQDMVEMSFSDNPFERRQSSINQSSSIVREVSNSNGQNSPDFKGRKLVSDSFNNLMSRQQSLVNQKSSKGGNFDSIEQLKQPFDFNLNKNDQVKPKFVEQLKSLMHELDNHKPEVEQKAQIETPVEPTEDKVLKLQLILNQQFTKQEQSKPNPKFASLKQKLGIKDFAIQNEKKVEKNELVNQIEKILADKEYRSSPLGKMYRLNENEVLFEERRSDPKPQEVQMKSINQPQIKKQEQIFKVASKKTMDQSLQDYKNTQQQVRAQTYIKQQNFDLFLKLMGSLRKKILSEAMMSLIQQSIDHQKSSLVLELSGKYMKRRVFKIWTQYALKIKGCLIIKKAADNIEQKIQKRIQQLVLQWKVNSLLKAQEKLIQKKELNGNGISRLALFFKHKNALIMMQTFENMKNQLALSLKLEKDQQKQQSIGLIVKYVQRKDQEIIVRRFSQFKKNIYRLTLDNSLSNFAQLLTRKLQTNAKEGFKSIVNFCIRNDNFKLQFQNLNNEYANQKAKIIEKQLTRVFRIIRLSNLKEGYSHIQKNMNNQRMKEKMLRKVSHIMQRYQQDQEKTLMTQTLKQWQRNSQQITQVQLSRHQSCKKIKLLLKVAQLKLVRYRFDLWKNETSHYIQLEITKISNERSVQRNKALEQVLIDLWWKNLCRAFSQIKTQSKIKKILVHIIEQNNRKNLKLKRQESFNKWKNQVYRFKLVKMSLIYLTKNFNRRSQIIAQELFCKWKQAVRQYNNEQKLQIKAANQIVHIFQKRSQKCLQRSYQIWNNEVSHFQRIKAALIKLATQKKERQLQIFITKWNKQAQEIQNWYHKFSIGNEIVRRLILKKKFNQLFKLAVLEKRKVQSLIKIGDLVQFKLKQSKVQVLQNMLMNLKQVKAKTIRQKEAMKIVKRVTKILNFKVIQRALLRWKLSAIDQQTFAQNQKLQKHYRSKLLANLGNKLSLKAQQKSFNQIRQYQQVQHNKLLMLSLKQSNLLLLMEKLHVITQKPLKLGFQSLLYYCKQQEQNDKVQIAISKLASVTRLVEIIEANRIDHSYFYKWRQESLKQQSFEFGIGLLDNFMMSKIQTYFQHFQQMSQVCAVERTRKKIGLNILKMFLIKQQKLILNKGFSKWQLQIQKFRPSKPILPPRATIIFNTSMERLSKRQDSIKLKNASAPPLLFKNSKSNSVNTSILSQRNNRYGQMLDDQEEAEEHQQYDEFEKVVDFQQDRFVGVATQNSQVLVVTANFNPYQRPQHKKRESLFSDRSSSINRRYESPKEDDHYEEMYPAEQNSQALNKNNPMQSSLFQFIQDEQMIEDEILSGNTQEYIISNQNSVLNLKGSQSGRNSISSNQSKGKQQSLNKYLSQNVSSQPYQNSGRRSARTHSQVKPNLPTQAPHLKPKEKRSPSHRSPIQKVNNKTQESLNKSLNRSKILSPKSSQGAILESVPEEDQRPQTNYPSMFDQKRQSLKNSTNSKISGFLNGKVNKEKRGVSKQQSIENNEKFRVFLTNKDSKSQSRATSKSIPRTAGALNNSAMNNKFLNTSLPNQNKVAKKRYDPSLVEASFSQIQKIFFRQAMEKIIVEAFSEEAEHRYKDRKTMNQLQGIKRVLQIRQSLLKRDAYLIQETFLLWKRSDYLLMLDSLQSYRNTLSLLYENRV